MNISDEDFATLTSLVSVVLDGPEHGVVTRDQVERAEHDLITLIRKLGGKPHGQKIDHLTRKYETP